MGLCLLDSIEQADLVACLGIISNAASHFSNCNHHKMHSDLGNCQLCPLRQLWQRHKRQQHLRQRENREHREQTVNSEQWKDMRQLRFRVSKYT